ncbi:MAG: hypothetical protein AVDCRST_MAG06-1556, partial [uncultured Nocardioides sp.]
EGRDQPIRSDRARREHRRPPDEHRAQPAPGARGGDGRLGRHPAPRPLRRGGVPCSAARERPSYARPDPARPRRGGAL